MDSELIGHAVVVRLKPNTKLEVGKITGFALVSQDSHGNLILISNNKLKIVMGHCVAGVEPDLYAECDHTCSLADFNAKIEQEVLNSEI